MKTFAPYVALGAVLFQLLFSWQRASVTPHAVLSATVFPREGLPELSQLMAESTHLLLVGPPGVGKTLAATAAARVDALLETPGGLVCLLPFYVDLYAIATSASTSGSTESTYARALRDFAEESQRYDLPLVRKGQSAARLGLWKLAEQTAFSVWRSIALTVPFLPREHEASLFGILSHVVDATQTLSHWRSCAGGAGRMHPVLILDEVHILNETEMDNVRADLLRFVSPQLQLKNAAPVTVVLLSSDARAHDILYSCACTLYARVQSPRKRALWARRQPCRRCILTRLPLATCAGAARGKLARRLEVLTVGDLHEDEVLPFLRFWRRGNNRDPPLPHFLDTPGALAAVYARVGGYIPDLLRVRRAKALDVVADYSAVAALVETPDAMLAQHGLEAEHVLTVFEAITARGVSQRGAVLLENLSPPVPVVQLSAMEAANLIEVRRHAILGEFDYAGLRELPPGTYVVAPCPLARESMAKAVTLLRKRARR